MTIEQLPQTPLRRSKRGQPIVEIPSDTPHKFLPISTYNSVHRRRTLRQDLLDDDYDAFTAQDTKIESLETHFFESFTLLEPSVTRPARTNRQSSRPSGQDSGGDVYRIGDTVYISSNAREPSIAVVIGIWTVVGQDVPPITRLLVHWFLRPSELPRVRADHNRHEHEIYYSLASTIILPVSAILAHCTVSSAVPESSPEKDIASSSLRIKQVMAQDSYCCRLAIDPRRCIYYEFQWESLVQEALAYPRNWGSDELVELWNIKPEEPPQTPRKPRQTRSITKGTDTRGSSSDVDDVSGPIDDEYAEPDEPPAENEEDINEGPAIPHTPSRRGRNKHTLSIDEDLLPRTPSRRGKRKRAVSLECNEEPFIEDDEDILPRTPSRRGKRTTATTPRRKRTRTAANIAAPTPHSKAALRARRKRALTVRPPPPDRASDISLHLATLPQDPWLRAMHVLHVASRPEALPCREDEYRKVLRVVEELIEEGSGGCVYVSGVPGTGKTATVHAVVRELKRMAERNEANPFTYVEINGLRIPEPTAAYGLLWEAVSGHNVSKEGHLKISSKEALKQLSKHFSSGDRIGPGGHACVVLMDELDQLMTSKQDVVYNFFNWPTLVESRLVVLAVANTMDLPERVMTGRVRSRLGMTRINFQPYTTPQLEKIVQARLQSAKEGLPDSTPDVIVPDGIKFAAMKVSSISGDARRVLDICRRTVELVQPHARPARTDDVKQVIKDMQNSPTAAYLRDLSFHERLMLAALLRCIKKEGIEEIRWGDVQHQHIVYMNLLTGETESSRRPTPAELTVVLDSLLASRAMLCEDGAVVSRKHEDDRRVVVNLEHTEVERVLGEVGGMKWKNVLSI